MGHEHLEMKNIPGAIQAYRNAVDCGIIYLFIYLKIQKIFGLGMVLVKHMNYNK